MPEIIISLAYGQSYAVKIATISIDRGSNDHSLIAYHEKFIAPPSRLDFDDLSWNRDAAE